MLEMVFGPDMPLTQNVAIDDQRRSDQDVTILHLQDLLEFIDDLQLASALQLFQDIQDVLDQILLKGIFLSDNLGFHCLRPPSINPVRG